jgi:cytochrome P450 family 110
MTTLFPHPTPPLAQLPDPQWLQTIQNIFHPLEYSEAARERYGDIFTFRFLHQSHVVVSHPQGLQTIFTADPELFDSGKTNATYFQPSLGDNSLVLLDGNRHQLQRKMLRPPFHGERMRAYGRLIREITEQTTRQWTVGKPFSMRESTQEISLRVILRTVFGLDEGDRFQKLQQFLKAMLEVTASPLRATPLFIPALQKDLGAWSPWGRFLRIRQQVDELIYAEIADRRRTSPGEDILSLMMLAQDENGELMTDVELRDELMTLLFAGQETTATALAWAFYWIHHHSEVREKLLRELESIDRDADPMEIAKLPYLNAVCCETLRIYPVVLFTFARMLKSPFEVMGYRLEPGTMLLPAIYLTHHREDLYPESKQFKPERFLERKYSAYEYLPFGGGNRLCVGYAFAQYKMKLVLATVLSQLQLQLADDRAVRPVRRGLTISPSGGVRMVMVGHRD